MKTHAETRSRAEPARRQSARLGAVPGDHAVDGAARAAVRGGRAALSASGGTPLTAQMVIAASVGVFLTVMVGTGLMSLVFLSNGSGHDDEVDDPFDER
jgi:hypothetical protein